MFILLGQVGSGGGIRRSLELLVYLLHAQCHIMDDFPLEHGLLLTGRASAMSF